MASSGARRWSTAMLLGVAACCALVSAQGVAGSVVAAPQHRAVVLIDDGVARRAHCVVFDGEISGIEALDATGEETVRNGFAGMGSAVCSIGGTGCSASQCLTCQAPKYWRYYRAEAGSSVFRPSGGGASSASVGDGDVEAWVWGNSSSAGAVPTVDSVCGARPTTTTTARPTTTRPAGDPVPPAPTFAPPGGTVPSVLPGPSPSAPTAGDPTPGGPTTAPDENATSATTADEQDAATDDDGSDDSRPPAEGEAATDLTIVDARGEQAAADLGSSSEGGGAGSWWGVMGVVLVLGGVAAWALLLRRRSAA